jgi:hypothetical protein
MWNGIRVHPFPAAKFRTGLVFISIIFDLSTSINSFSNKRSETGINERAGIGVHSFPWNARETRKLMVNGDAGNLANRQGPNSNAAKLAFVRSHS